VFVDGKLFTTLQGANIATDFMQIVNNYVANRYAQQAVQLQ
jgi:hypothetical protein